MPSPQQLLSSAGSTINKRLNNLLCLCVVFLLALPLSAPSTATAAASTNKSSRWAHWSMEGREVCPSARAWVTHPGSFCTTLWHSPYLSNKTELERREQRAIISYCEVDRILERFDCSQEFSVNVKRGQCKLCRQAYREWACAMVTDTLEDGQLDCFTKLMPCPSCASICHQVMRLCPYLSPDRMQFDIHGHNLPAVSQYGGHPAFYCPLENDDPSDPAYTSLCFNSSPFSHDPDYVHNICTNPPLHSHTTKLIRKQRTSSDFSYDDENNYHHNDNYSDWTPPPHYTTCCWTYASSVVTFINTQPFPRYGSDAYFNTTTQEPSKPSLDKPTAANYSNNLVILNCCDSHGSCSSQQQEDMASSTSSEDADSSALQKSESYAPEKPPLFKTRKRSSEIEFPAGASTSSSEEIDIDTVLTSTPTEGNPTLEETLLYKTIELKDDSSDSLFIPNPTTHIVGVESIDYDEHYVDTEPEGEAEGGSSSTEDEDSDIEVDVLGVDKFFDKLWTHDDLLTFKSTASASSTTTLASTTTTTTTSTSTSSSLKTTKDNNFNDNLNSGDEFDGSSSVHYQKNQFMAIVIGEGDDVERHHLNLRTRRTKQEFKLVDSEIQEKKVKSSPPLPVSAPQQQQLLLLPPTQQQQQQQHFYPAIAQQQQQQQQEERLLVGNRRIISYHHQQEVPSAAPRLQVFPMRTTYLISVFSINIIVTISLLVLLLLCFFSFRGRFFFLWSFNFLPIVVGDVEDEGRKSFKKEDVDGGSRTNLFTPGESSSRRSSSTSTLSSSPTTTTPTTSTLIIGPTTTIVRRLLLLRKLHTLRFYCNLKLYKLLVVQSNHLSGCNFKLKIYRFRPKNKSSRTSRRKCKWKWRFRFRNRDINNISSRRRFAGNFQNGDFKEHFESYYNDNSAFTVQSLLNCLEPSTTNFEKHNNKILSSREAGKFGFSLCLRVTSDDNKCIKGAEKKFRHFVGNFNQVRKLLLLHILFKNLNLIPLTLLLPCPPLLLQLQQLLLSLSSWFSIKESYYYDKCKSTTTTTLLVLLGLDSPRKVLVGVTITINKELLLLLLLLVHKKKKLTRYVIIHSCTSCHTTNFVRNSTKFCPSSAGVTNFGCEFLNFRRRFTSFTRNLEIPTIIRIRGGGQSNYVYSTCSVIAKRRKKRKLMMMRRKVRVRSLIASRDEGQGRASGALSQGQGQSDVGRSMFRLYLSVV